MSSSRELDPPPAPAWRSINAVRALAMDASQIFAALAVADVHAASDVFLPLFRSSDEADGFVSLEVSPALAYDSFEQTLNTPRWQRRERGRSGHYGRPPAPRIPGCPMSITSKPSPHP